jgi:GWxTD domain-containing protein
MSQRGTYLTLTLLVLSSVLTVTGQKNKPTKAQEQARKNEESGNYYKKWPQEEVPYIIAPDEETAFKQLKTDEERESFIEQFWLRRDPSPDTLDNEYREEYYRRIVQANEKFTSGIPGWKTDRGRIYIMHGPADEVETHAMGGTYLRSNDEGGGRTSTFPFETWRYRNIEGMGNNIILEFVDSSMSGEYRLEFDPSAKDALLHVPGVGLTEYEERMGLDKADRLNRDFATAGSPFGTGIRGKTQFDMLQQYYDVQKAPEVKYKDLEEKVRTSISYNVLPFSYRADYIKVTEELVMVPITVQVSEKYLTFKEETMAGGEKGLRATGRIEGRITDLTGKVVQRIEDAFEAFRLPSQASVDNVQTYQKVVYLKPGRVYRLFLLVNDAKSNNSGTIDTRLDVKRFPDGNLSASSLMMADYLDALPPRAVDSQFRIGNLKVRPRVTKSFKQNEDMWLFAEVYGLKLDETTHKPNVATEVVVTRDGQEVKKIKDEINEVVGAASQMNFKQQFDMKEFEPGEYRVDVKITDKLASSPLVLTEKFTVTK